MVRVLDHWDNFDGLIERGFASVSLWRWQNPAGLRYPRYGEYDAAGMKKPRIDDPGLWRSSCGFGT
jgi:alpha-glucuronidase